MRTSARVEGVGQMWTPANRGYEKGSFFVDALYGRPLRGNPQHLEKYLKRQCLTKQNSFSLRRPAQNVTSSLPGACAESRSVDSISFLSKKTIVKTKHK